MPKGIKIIGVSFGAADDPSSCSGVNYYLFGALRKYAEVVVVLDATLSKIKKILIALKTFSPNRERWGNKLVKHPASFSTQSRVVQKKLSEYQGQYNAILQYGALFIPFKKKPDGIVYSVYLDNTMFLSERSKLSKQLQPFAGKIRQKRISNEKLVYNNADLIFCFSSIVKDSLCQDYGVDESKIKVTAAGSKINAVQRKKTLSNNILFVGIDFERKGGRYLLKAFKLLRKEISQAKLIIIGSSPSIPDDESDGVEVVGYISPDKKEKLDYYYDKAAVFVMPSIHEPFGLVYLEAMARGIPCVASDRAGIIDIIKDGETGYLVNPEDPQQIADALVKLLANENRYYEMSEKAINLIEEKYTWDHVALQMAESIRMKLEAL